MTEALNGVAGNAELCISDKHLVVLEARTLDNVDLPGCLVSRFELLWTNCWKHLELESKLKALHEERAALLAELGIAEGATIAAIAPEETSVGTRKITI